MTYATAQDLIDRFGTFEIEDLATTPDQDVLDTDKLNSALADATAEIDSYLGQRYTLPLNTVPAILTAVCSDLARYALYAANAPEEVQTRYNKRIAWLRDIATNRASLGVESQSKPATLTAATRSKGRRLTRDTLRHFCG